VYWGVGGAVVWKVKKFPVTSGFLEKLVTRKCGDIQMHDDLKVKLPSRCGALEAEIGISKGPNV
jgi:hypothetical protein